MSKTGFAGLLIAALYAGFVVGKTVSKSEKGPVLSGEATKKHRGTSREDDRVHGLRSINDNLLNNLAEKERRISELENELKRLGEQSASALSSEEEKVRTMRRAAALKKGDELRCDILQRKDKVLREQAFAELAALLRSGRPEDILLGLATLGRLGGLDSDKPQDPNLCSKTLRSLWGFDKESFKALVLATFDNRDAEVRQAALKCLPLVCSKEEYLNTLHSSIADRSPEVRRDVVERIGSETKQGELTQDIATALTELLHDDDKRVRVAALGVLSRREAYAQELEEMAVELSRDPEVSEAMIGVLARMRPIGAKAAERLVQMFDGGYNAYQLFSEGTHYGLSDDAKAIVRRFALRILTESVEPYDRWMAWRTLIRIGDDSILPQLEELALSDNREGIEERLTGLIAHIRLNYVELPQMKEGYAVLDPDTHISEHTWHMEPWHPYSAK